MLVLCPNHHIQFDHGILRLRRIGSTFKIDSKVPSDPLDGQQIASAHKIEDRFVRYHYEWFD